MIITSTRVASILGESPYETPELARKRMQNTSKRSFSCKATQYGKKMEYIGLRRYGDITGNTLPMNEEQKQYTHPQYPFLVGCPDGITSDNRLVEIKCLYQRKITNTIPVHHYHQIQALLHVCDLSICDYVQFKPQTRTQKEQIHIIDVEIDQEWMNKHIHILATFSSDAQQNLSMTSVTSGHLKYP